MIATIIYRENEIWVRTPFNKEFIDWIKSDVMIDCRHWDEEEKVWVISYSYEDDLIMECFKLFHDVKRVGTRSAKKTGPRAWKRPKQSPMDGWTAYDVLHIQPSAPPELIKAAYRVMVKLYHPDVYDGLDATDQMKKINDAYEKIRKVEKLP
jgi:hypothetical protein